MFQTHHLKFTVRKKSKSFTVFIIIPHYIFLLFIFYSVLRPIIWCATDKAVFYSVILWNKTVRKPKIGNNYMQKIHRHALLSAWVPFRTENIGFPFHIDVIHSTIQVHVLFNTCHSSQQSFGTEYRLRTGTKRRSTHKIVISLSKANHNFGHNLFGL